MTTSRAAEDAEFVLKRDSLEAAGIQERRSPCIIFDLVIFDLVANSRWIVVDPTLIGHCNDVSFKIWAPCGDGLLKMGRECRDAASPRQGIADKR